MPQRAVGDTYIHASGTRLDKSFAELDDAACRTILQDPRKAGNRVKCETCTGSTHAATLINGDIHELILSGNNLSSFGASGLTEFIVNCPTLVVLEVQGNDIGVRCH